MPEDWKAACTDTKGNRSKFANHRGISILTIPEKIYGRMLISR